VPAIQSTLRGDFYIDGLLAAKTFTLPSGAVTDDSVAGLAGIDAAKLQHQYLARFAQERATDAAVEGRVVHVAEGAAGTIMGVYAGAVVAAGASSSATIDVLVNGATVLSGTITLDNTTASYALKGGTVSDDALAAGDVVEVRVTAVSGANKPKGVFVSVVIREDAQ
jgi:hypothetical protein